MLHTLFNTKIRRADFTIIGMGGAGTSTFIQFIDSLMERDINCEGLVIELVERGNMAGPGYAYHPVSQRSSAWTLNNQNSTMSLYGDLRLITDFSEWLNENREACLAKYADDDLLQANLRNPSSLYAPRKIFGEYCRSRLVEYLGKARALGVTVKLSLNTDVIAADNLNGEWLLKTSSGGRESTLITQNIIITTGHLPGKKAAINAPSADLKNYAADAYSHQLNIEQDKTVMIAGSGLSAIDVMKDLLSRGHQGKIYMVSPSGELPKVKPDQKLGMYEFKYLTRGNLCVKDLTLETILELFCKELGVEIKDSAIHTVAALIATPDQSAYQVFSHELDASQGEPRLWQKIFGSIWYEVLFMIAHHIRECDRHIFFNKYFNHFMKWAAGMTLENAKIIESVLGGQLQLVAYEAAAGIQYCADNAEFKVTAKNGECVTADYLISGMGAGYNIADNVLLKNMQVNGSIAGHRDPGGIKVDESFRVLDADNKPHDNAWSVGVVTFGSNPSANSIICAAMNAREIVASMVAKLDKRFNASAAVSF